MSKTIYLFLSRAHPPSRSSLSFARKNVARARLDVTTWSIQFRLTRVSIRLLLIFFKHLLKIDAHSIADAQMTYRFLKENAREFRVAFSIPRRSRIIFFACCPRLSAISFPMENATRPSIRFFIHSHAT